ncbi:hypothetical protein [Kitasatospora sp. NPDC088134]|uniref:hypothetical protein n=1 Tax=Kitasatospora sp. NPDC088134 TaxID=3364071 RepID=UPI0038118EC3
MNPRRVLAVLALLAATAFGGSAVGYSTAEPAASDSGQVAAFNDGWSDAMRDACDQGSAYACNWLATKAR